MKVKIGSIATRADGKRLEPGKVYDLSEATARALLAARRATVVADTSADAEKDNQAADKAAAETQAKTKAGAKSEG